ncbi:hypothetical protein SEA_LYMARA_69 [Arthrobacter phage Lymara]|uniref:Uncharacterized protein n=1 Tax=Arthrobacter phage Lymara TaxID=2599828 RepID=A0A5J6TVN3_9CAUD|nr:hypothetical protein HYQ01_gp069 [Arthrobacter phage Lymara]QFG14870.1 hypothetical protein SEA_LYMARA_69 [Arthrobacter phage Lymara]
MDNRPMTDPDLEPAVFELAFEIFTADNDSFKGTPEELWASSGVHHTAYAFNIARALIAKGYSKTPGDMVRVEEVRPVIAEITDPDPCQRDMNGGCQTHLYLDLKPDDQCPQQVAKTWLQDHPEPKAEPGAGDLLCHGGCGNFTPWTAVNTELSRWTVTTTSTKDSGDPGAHIRVWCPACGPWGGTYATD